MNTIEDIHAAFLKAISTDVIESPALDQLVSPEDQITIVISDMTRFWMRQDIICEELVRYLNEVIGIPFEHIVVLIGLGTHHKNTPADQKVLTGAYVYDHVAAVVDHDCDAPDLVDIGTTSYGTRVLIQSAVHRPQGHLHRRHCSSSDGRLRRRQKEHRSRYCRP